MVSGVGLYRMCEWMSEWFGRWSSLGLFVYVFALFVVGFLLVSYGCSSFGFSLLLESLVTCQSRNLPLRLARRSTWHSREEEHKHQREGNGYPPTWSDQQHHPQDGGGKFGCKPPHIWLNGSRCQKACVGSVTNKGPEG